MVEYGADYFAVKTKWFECFFPSLSDNSSAKGAGGSAVEAAGAAADCRSKEGGRTEETRV